MMFSYIAYGLGIHSALPLPELVASEVACDVMVRLGQVGRLPAVDDTGCGFWVAGQEACHFLQGVGAFMARRGQEIIVDPAPGVEAHVLRLSLLGPALALILHQRGRFLLHASVVAVADRAVAFLGASGWGKSTFAAVMHGRGHSVVADDIAVIDVGSRPPKVFPGFPQLKLWPDAVVALGDVPEALPQLHPLFEKRARRILRQFSQDPLPLRGLYVLGRASAPSVEPLSPQEALGELMRHWYGHRFGRELLRLFGHASLFLHCANLANTIPVCRLDRPASLRTLPAVARLVEAHLAHDGLRAVARAPYVQRGRVERP